MRLQKSLPFISLMLALVATIAFIATQTYKSHNISNHLAAFVPIVDRLIQQAVVYANENGHFPNLTQMGLSDTNTIQAVGNDKAHAEKINTYFVNLKIADISQNGNACGQAGIIEGDLNGALLGLKASSKVAFSCTLTQENNAVNSKCSYYYGAI